MKFERFSNISKSIYNRLLNKESIEEDSLRVFSEEVFNFSQLESFDEKDIPSSFEDLSVYLRHLWYSNAYQKDDASLNFLIGFLLGNIEIINHKKQKYNQTERNKIMSNEQPYKVLLLIKEYPGILSKDLANRINISEKDLLDLMKDVYSYFYTYNYGTNRFYYLTLEGETFLKETCK